MAGLLLNFGANVKQATAGIKEVSLSLKDQQAILKNLQREYASLSTTQARGGLGKAIAADIKIANAEVSRLKAAAVPAFGAVGAASSKAFSSIRSLAQILPGIGIAGIFGLAFQGIASLFSKTSVEADKLKEKVKDLINSISEVSAGAAGSTSGDLALVQSLSNAVLDQTLSYEKRNRALTELKQINKGYFGDLTVETAALGGLTKAVEEYTNALIAAAVIKAFSDEIGKVGVELSKQLSEYNKLGNALDALKRKRDDTKQFITTENNLGVAVKSTSGAYKTLTGEIDKTQRKLSSSGDAVTKLGHQMGDLKTAIQAAVNESLGFKDLDPPPIQKFKEDFFNPLMNLLQRVPFAISRATIDVSRLNDIQIQSDKLKTFKELVEEKISKQLEGLVVEPKLTISTRGFRSDAYIKDLQKLNDDISKTLQATATDLVANFGEALGTALAGGDMKGVFGNFATILANGFSAIGRQLIAASPIIVALKAALKTLQAPIMLAAGIALVAIGAALRATVGKGVSARATGGPVSGGTPYKVGERGEEIFVPSSSGRIIPNNMLGGMQGSASPVIIFNGQLAVSGNKLQLLLNRTDRYNNANV